MTTLILELRRDGAGFATGYLAGLRGLVGLWIARARQRRQLGCMQDWQLRDIGVTRAQAMREAAKPFWRE